MKFVLAILSVALAFFVVGLGGCSKKETPAPVVIEQNPKDETPSGKPELQSPSSVPIDLDRKAAAWVLGIGGKVRIVVDGQKREVKNVTDLPGPPFKIDVLDTQSKPLDDTDLEKLDGLSQLKALGIRDVPITGSGLAHVRGLTELEVLGLERTRVADASLQHLKNMPKLINLHLDRTPVTDGGLAHLLGTKLTILRLGGTKVTDAGLEHLKKIKSLRSISLNDTAVTDAGVADFKKVVPTCEVLR